MSSLLPVTPVACFVIGPIGDKLAPLGSADRQRYEDGIEVFERVISPACGACGLDPVRSDLLPNPGDITEQVCRHLHDDDVVIADVTGANANVMYELGLRHTRNLLTIPIGERGTLPFDISVIRTVIFERTTLGLIEARDKLEEMLVSGLPGGSAPVTPTRIWCGLEAGVSMPAAAAAAAAAGNGEPPEEPGFLELLAEAEAAVPQAVQHLESMGKLVQGMGNLASEYAPRMSRASSAGARLVLANGYAQEIEPIAEEFETEAGLYADATKQADAGTSYLLDRIERKEYEPGELASVRNLLTSVATAGEQSKSALPSTVGFEKSLVAAANATRRLRGPVQRVSRGVRRFLDGTDTIQRWGDRGARLLGGLPPEEPPPVGDSGGNGLESAR